MSSADCYQPTIVRLRFAFSVGVALCCAMNCCFSAHGEGTSKAATQSDTDRSINGETDQRNSSPIRGFVRDWKFKNLRREFRLLNEGRSFENGKKLFTEATCSSCHRMNEVGGTLGPDLTGVSGRNGRAIILQEIIEPSKKLPENYRPVIINTVEGRVFQGLVLEQDEKSITLASDPNEPTKIVKILRDDIDELSESNVSMMPKGLLNTLTKEEIFDLLAYIEARGEEDHPAYDLVE